MKIRVILLVLLAMLIAAWGTLRISSRSEEQERARLERAPDRGSVYWHARLAKANGKKEVVLPTPLVEYSTGIKTLDELLPNIGVVVAQPILKKTVIASTNELYSNNEIRTWYKFKILENLSKKTIPACPTCSSEAAQIPQDMLPLDSDQILIETYGGSVEVDNIKVTMFERQIPAFSISEAYLMFLLTDTSGKVGLLRMGAAGIYSIDSNGIIKPASREPHPIIDDLQTRYGNSLELLRERIQRESILQ